ncbi:MAG: FAD-binding oxidoreductase [Zetaproteobacteria bacterium]|nr:FAD-binding oxidoreductase [Zetaproteobacteria bacterium]
MNQHAHSSIDVIIVGAGLAGSILAYRLLQHGARVRVIHAPSVMPPASRVAAGIINPITGQRFVLQAQADLLLQEAVAFYHHIEHRFKVKVWHPLPMQRAIQTLKQQQAWKKRQDAPDYQPYWDALKSSDLQLMQKQTGYLDTNILLDTLHHHFMQLGCLYSEEFYQFPLEMTENETLWNGVRSKKIIFCEGWRAQSNPWFAYLPFQPAKGEILTLTVDQSLTQKILNDGKWLLPISPNQCKFGASYENNVWDEVPTAAVQAQLLDHFATMQPALTGVRVINHQAGVRAGTADKQPVLGWHPHYPSLGIFNGLGSKASMLTPWYSAQWSNYFFNQTPLPAHSDIARFSSRLVL